MLGHSGGTRTFVEKNELPVRAHKERIQMSSLKNKTREGSQLYVMGKGRGNSCLRDWVIKGL